MKRKTLNVQWDELATTESLPIWSHHLGEMLKDTRPLRQPRCPSCKSIVYTRRHASCSVCGQTLPQDCRFTLRQAQKVERLLAVERQRHRIWLRRLGASV